MNLKTARADVGPRRQRNQYNCCTTSLSMALEALGIPPEECSIENVNRVLGAMPLRGAAWEQVAGAASHFGCRATLVVPSTLRQVRDWTDAGIPVIIGWNTGNEWSHASLIFDVTDDLVYIADPNIPNPDKTVRTLSHDEFYEKWWEKSGEGYKVRRPAMAIEREITPDGRQVMASADPDFQKFWDVELKKLSVKYNLSDPKGQVNFRIAVSSKTEDLKFSGLRELVKTWGGKSQGRTQQDFAFALADAWMKRQGRQVMASGPPRDADKVPGTDLFVSKEPSQSPWRGQKPQYKVYNRHGGVIGGSPDRAKAISMAKAEFSKTAKSKATKPTVKQTAEFLKKMGLKPPFDIIPRSKSGRNPVVVVTLEEDEAERVRMKAKAKRWNVRWEPQDDDQIQLAIRTDDQKPIPGLARVAFEKTAEAADCWSDYKAGGLSWEDYQECLKRFGDEDDRDDYRPSYRPLRPSYAVQAKWYIDWANIAKLMGRTKDAEFIESVAGYVRRRSAPSPKQGVILDKIRKRYIRELKDPQATIRRLEAEKKRQENAPKPPEAPRAPSGPDDREKVKYLDQLARRVSRMPGGPQLVEKVRGDYESGQQPSSDDLKKIRNFMYRSGLKPMADHFRTASYSGNPNGKPIYPNEIDHGYDQALSGGTDVMQRLVNRYKHEQGDVVPQRPVNPKVASLEAIWWGR